jgi:hypothetical protein
MKGKIMIACLAMALVAASAYILMGVGIFKPGNLTSGDMPVFYYVIPAAYIAMGVLVFLKKRWMFITFAAITAFTIVAFYAMYANQLDVMWSAPGLITKIAQVILEAGLIYLIFTYKRQPAPEIT